MDTLREQLEKDADEFMKAAGINNEFTKQEIVTSLYKIYKTKENYNTIKSFYSF